MLGRVAPFVSKIDTSLAHRVASGLNMQARAAGWDVHCDASLDFAHAGLNAMRGLWLAKSAARLPARSDFSMRELKPFLPNLTVLEILHEGGRTRYLHRFVGMEIVRRLGEITGRCIDEVLPPSLAVKTITYFDAVATHGVALGGVTNFQFTPVNYLQCEMLMMPLADDGATPDRLMSVSYFRTAVRI